MIWNKKPFAWEQDGFDNAVIRVATGLNPRQNFTLNSGGNNYYVTIKNFEHGVLYLDDNCDKIDDIALKQIQERSDLRKDDILFSSIGRVGDCYLIENQPKNWNINESVFSLRPNKEIINPQYLFHVLHSDNVLKYILNNVTGSTFKSIKISDLKKAIISVPSIVEQEKISKLFSQLDSLVALHQRKQKGEKMFKKNNRKKELFWEYYEDWVKVYKEGAVRNVTLRKYHLTLSWLKRIIPDLRIKDLTRVEYQELINRFAECHEKQTTMDFHHHLNAAIEDAIDEGLIEKNPTRKAIIKGKTPRPKKPKYLNQYELHSLLGKLELKDKPSMDWLVLLIAKTGIRFSEAIAVTPADFDFVHQTLTINKTWDYKENSGFQPTKNKSSIRKIQIDWMVVSQFSNLIKDLHPEKPIFVTKEKIYNSTANDLLEKRCKQAGVPVISIHGLRHTHASILLFAGVSVASVAKRLGHSTMTTTEKVYLHIIQELENKDIDLVMRSLSGLI